MSQVQDQRFFRNYSLIVGALAVMILVFFIFAQILGTNQEAYIQQRAGVVAERTKPEGRVRIAGQSEPAREEAGPEAQAAGPETAGAGDGEETGKQVYNSLCFTCHGSEAGQGGLPNVPHFGDADAWADRIAQGNPLLYERAINGYTGASGIPMPPKGGNPGLTDDEIRAAVDFIVANSQ